ncbi:MAG: hypothetical protein Q7U74_13155 [Saprospiraceae bacterium]|nr:hypothetical protein [Saprospiraceae bacterium]
MDIKAQRLDILQQVENGEMTLEEASRWLAALDKIKSNGKVTEMDAVVVETAVSFVPENIPTEATELPWMIEEPPSVVLEPQVVETSHRANDDQVPSVWQGGWLLVFVPGLLLAVASVNWMYSGFRTAGLSWGFWLSFFPFTLAVILMWLGSEIRLTRWLHLLIRQKQGSYPSVISLHFPLPLGLLSWVLRRFRHFASPVQGKDVGDFLNEIDQTVTTDGLMHIEVNDPDGGHVEIWIDGPKKISLI